MKYQYKSQGFKNDFYGKNQFKLTAVHLICIINVLIFLLFSSSSTNFGVDPIKFKSWQLITYMFIHAGPLHLGFNMYVLWIFGTHIESIWGFKKFIIYYFLTGIFSGVCIYFFSVSSLTTIGASGAIFSIVAAYAYIYPNRMISFWFIPVQARTIVLILFWTQLGLFILQIVQLPFFDTKTSYIAHLAGILSGYCYIKFGNRFFTLCTKLLKVKIIKKSQASNIKQKSTDNVDKILDKLKIEGWDGLTKKEREKLFQASKEKKHPQHLN